MKNIAEMTTEERQMEYQKMLVLTQALQESPTLAEAFAQKYNVDKIAERFCELVGYRGEKKEIVLCGYGQCKNPKCPCNEERRTE